MLNALAYDSPKPKAQLLNNTNTTNFKCHKYFNKFIFYWYVFVVFVVFAITKYALGSGESSIHSLRLGLHRSLICFATLAFVSQRQENSRYLPSPLVFQLISTHFTATPTVLVPRTILNPTSISTRFKVKP